jgi:hypothetical protein
MNESDEVGRFDEKNGSYRLIRSMFMGSAHSEFEAESVVPLEVYECEPDCEVAMLIRNAITWRLRLWKTRISKIGMMSNGMPESCATM